MAEITLDETCPECDLGLIKITEDDPSNPHSADAIVCPGCFDCRRLIG